LNKPNTQTELMIQLTYKCTLDCIHCSYGGIRDCGSKYGPDVWSFLYQYKPQLIKISGGEPTLSENFDYVVRGCKETGAKVITFTNGLQEPRIHPDFYWVSLYGNRKIHNSITRADTFEKTVAFIEAHEVEYLNSPVFGRQQLKSLREMGEKLDIPLRITRMIAHGNATNVLPLYRQQRLVKSLKLDKKPHWVTCSLGMEPSRCWKKICLRPDGSTIICTALVRGLPCPFRKKISTLLWNKLFKQ